MPQSSSPAMCSLKLSMLYRESIYCRVPLWYISPQKESWEPRDPILWTHAYEI